MKIERITSPRGRASACLQDYHWAVFHPIRKERQALMPDALKSICCMVNYGRLRRSQTLLSQATPCCPTSWKSHVISVSGATYAFFVLITISQPFKSTFTRLPSRHYPGRFYGYDLRIPALAGKHPEQQRHTIPLSSIDGQR